MLLLAATTAYAFHFQGLPSDAGQNWTELGAINYLPRNAEELDKKFGIQAYVVKSSAPKTADTQSVAADYFNAITKTPESKIILIWISRDRQDGAILVTDNIKQLVPESYINMLQDDVLHSLAGRWYVSDVKLSGKILGTFLYLLEKPGLTKQEIEARSGSMIRVDDNLYNISQAPLIVDLINLFYFEPMSFCFYFPLVMYALIVRLLGSYLGGKSFPFLNGVWVGVVGFIFILIMNRINIFYPEYVSMFTFFMGLNAPIYIMLYWLYADKIEAAAYGYLYNVTGGFGANNIFSNKTNI
jgi:hypothetical protein